MHSLGIIYIALGLFLVLTHIPLYFNMVGPNRHYGVKTAKAFESHKNWYKINLYWAKRVLVWGSFIVLLGIFCFLPFPDNSCFYIILALPLITAIPPVIMIMRYIHNDEKWFL